MVTRIWVSKYEAAAICRKLSFKKNMALPSDERAELLLQLIAPHFDACEKWSRADARKSGEREAREIVKAVSERMRAKAAAIAAGEDGEPTGLSEEILAMPLTTYDNLPDSAFRGISLC